MDETFTILLYKDLVKITYNDAQALNHYLFQQVFIKKIEFPGNIMVRYYIRWRVKRFIKKKLMYLNSPPPSLQNVTFEFLDFDALNYHELFGND